jgi:hypothetical protein
MYENKFEKIYLSNGIVINDQFNCFLGVGEL